MRSLLRSAVLLAFVFSTAALHAQVRISLFGGGTPEPGAYEGYWSPYSQPEHWDYRMGSITFQNRTGSPVSLYHVDRYNHWTWAGRLLPGQAQTVKSPVGDYWVAQDRWGDAIQRVQATGRPQVVDIRISGYVPRPSHPERRQVDILVRNKTGHDVDLYNVDRFGRWVWVARIDRRHGEVDVRSFPGQRWKGVNDRGVTVVSFQAGSDDERVVID